MSRIYSLDNEFDPCPMCRAKPGSPELCLQCLERRELLGVMSRIEQALKLSLPKMRDAVEELVRVCAQCKVDRRNCRRHGR